MADLARAAFLCLACNKLLKEPKTLPCGHTFCKACLQAHCIETAVHDSFACPRCSTAVKVKEPNMPLFDWADTLPTNSGMNNSLEKMWRIEEEKTQFKCMLCLQKWKAVRANKYCKSCAEYFCDECGNQHWLLRSSKEHRMWMIDDLARLQRDPLVQARLELVFSAKYRAARARTRRRSSIFDKLSLEVKPADPEECDITGACFLAECIVLADRGNGRLTLVDENYVVQSVFKTPCHDVVAINQYFIAVTCPEDHCFKILSVYNHVIEEDRTIPLDAECYGVCRIGDNFAVGLAGRPPTINVYSGSVLQQEIKLEQGKFAMRKPRYLAYHVTTERFYISDSSANSLKGVTKTGTIVWEKHIERCNGLAMFGSYLLISRSDRNSVDLVNQDGKILKSVVTSEAGLVDVRVLCLDYWSEENSRRLVVVDAAELVHVFVLSDPMQDDDLVSYVNKHSGAKQKGTDEDEEKDHDKQTRFCIVL